MYSTTNVQTQEIITSTVNPRVVARYIHALNHSFIQTYSLKKAIKKFGRDWSFTAAIKELKQQHKQACFVPTHKKDMTPEKLAKILEMVSFMVKK